MRMGGDVKVKAEPEMSDSKMTAVENRKQFSGAEGRRSSWTAALWQLLTDSDKASPNESEIHPSHKPAVCTLCISRLHRA